jgi:hypothetical protein
MARGSDQIVRGVRTRTGTGDARIDAPIRFTRALVEKRGWAEEAEVQGLSRRRLHPRTSVRGHHRDRSRP